MFIVGFMHPLSLLSEYFLISRWQQLLINRIVGYDTILMNSLLSSPGQGINSSPDSLHLFK